ncbi:MAG: LGFP repeat-containing protein [Thermodesulfobacteriota bacterium]
MSEIENKHRQSVNVLGRPIDNENPCIDGVGRYRDYEKGSIYFHPNTGAHTIHGAILHKWSKYGSERGFGYPINDTSFAPDGTGLYNHFKDNNGEHSIYWTYETGAHMVTGAIRERWKSLNWERWQEGGLGYPITDELGVPIGIGRFSCFRRLDPNRSIHTIEWNPMSGAQEHAGLPFCLLPSALSPLRVEPKLSLYQDDAWEGNQHEFKSKADLKANRIRAFQNPQISHPLNQSVGSTPYDNGLDIINAIEAVYFCSGGIKKVNEVHIFSHGRGEGVYSTRGSYTGGLYVREFYLVQNRDNRERGGCTIDMIPTGLLSDDVVFVLHSCGPAEVRILDANYGSFAGEKYGPFAYQLWQHLDRGGLKRAKVFGQTRHHNISNIRPGQAVWKEFSETYRSRGKNGGPLRKGLPGYEQI